MVKNENEVIRHIVFTHIYGNEAEALKALRTEPEYKDFF